MTAAHATQTRENDLRRVLAERLEHHKRQAARHQSYVAEISGLFAELDGATGPALTVIDGGRSR